MNTGAYCLLIELDREKDLIIGRRASAKFPSGFYIYVGSAMNSLEHRINRHLSRNKKLHWHIDWLLAESKVIAVRRIESCTRLECEINNLIARISERTVMKGFGASDCSCNTHLHYFECNPDWLLDNALSRLQIENQKNRSSAIRIMKTPVSGLPV